MAGEAKAGASERERLHQWLAGAAMEEVMEPSLPIIDPHHHLWDLRVREGGGGFAEKVYLCEEIVAELREGGHNVQQTVFLQCNAFHRADGPEALRPVGETEFAHGVAAMSASGAYGTARICAGIISTVDLSLGVESVEEALLAHMRASPNFRGIRAPLPSAGEHTAEFDSAFALLGKHGLCYEQYAHDWKTSLPVLARLAKRHPSVQIVINHLGGKLDWDEIPAHSSAFRRWRECLDAAAACPNVVIKCGGLTPPSAMPIHMNRRAVPIGSAELADLWLPYHAAAVHAFGPKRCMFESNFPVDKECVSYRTVWNAFKRIAKHLDLSAEDTAAIFHDTAARVYQLLPLQAVVTIEQADGRVHPQL